MPPRKRLPQLGTQARLAKRALEARDREGYWAGVTWVYHAEVQNGVGVTTNHEYDVVPGEDNEFHLGWGYLHNGSTTAARNGFIIVNAKDDQIGTFLRFLSIPLGVRAHFPQESNPLSSSPHAEIGVAGGRRLIFASLMEIHAEILSVTSTQFSEFAIVGRVRGEKPTVTITTPDPDVTVNVRTDEFF